MTSASLTNFPNLLKASWQISPPDLLRYLSLTMSYHHISSVLPFFSFIPSPFCLPLIRLSLRKLSYLLAFSSSDWHFPKIMVLSRRQKLLFQFTCRFFLKLHGIQVWKSTYTILKLSITNDSFYIWSILPCRIWFASSGSLPSRLTLRHCWCWSHSALIFSFQSLTFIWRFKTKFLFEFEVNSALSSGFRLPKMETNWNFLMQWLQFSHYSSLPKT